MAISGDLLTSATPARLLCRRGTWVLELVRLVAVERNVFQPRVQRLEGAEAVLQHLKRSGDNPALAAAASQLIRGPRPEEEERAFDAVDGDWVPGELGAHRESTRPSAPPPGGGNAGEVAALRTELLLMRAVHERLRERVHRLESQLQDSEPAHDVLSVEPTPSFAMPAAPNEPEPAATAGGGDSLWPAHANIVPSVPAPAAGAASAAPTGMALPSVEDLNAGLQALIGDVGTVQNVLPMWFQPGDLGPCWVSRIIDDEGRDVGVLVVDLGAALSLGGALISLSNEELEAQRALGTPSADVLGAMAEVGHALCETVNNNGGLQVRATPSEPLTPGSLDWAEKAGAESGLELELISGLGRLFLFAR